MRCHIASALLLTFAISTSSTIAADNTLTPTEQKAGWKLLFNGKNLTGWKTSNGKPIQTKVEEGSIVPYKSGGYLVINEKQFGDFVLKCDVMWQDERCNSGIFLRIDDPKNPVHTGFEIQVMAGDKTGKHEMGAIYDLVTTSKNAGKKTGEWNSFEIRCKGSNISVTLNGSKVSEINTDEFTEPGVCPDGQKHKFKLKKAPRAVKDFARKGFLGFQDHGHKVWYKNVKLLELK
jgi:hypothetical protein